jgi:hypothetical protein
MIAPCIAKAESFFFCSMVVIRMYDNQRTDFSSRYVFLDLAWSTHRKTGGVLRILHFGRLGSFGDIQLPVFLL